jgi:hypothetical protein
MSTTASLTADKTYGATKEAMQVIAMSFDFVLFCMILESMSI